MNQVSPPFSTALTIALLLLLTANARADEPAKNFPHIVQSQNGQYIASFTPTSDYGENGEGRIRANNSPKEMYAVHWFTFTVNLSNDGHFLIRHGPWAMDRKEGTDLAIAFYKDGILLKSYEVKDLVHDMSTVDRTVSHYRWEAGEASIPRGFSADNTRYTLVTTDKQAYEFNVTTGEILSVRTDETARTQRNLYWDDNEKAEALARDYIKRTPKLASMGELFSFTSLSAKHGIMGGVTLKGEEWFGDLHPINPKLSRAMAEAVFLIDPNTDLVEVGIDPQELEQLLLDIGSVPFVKKLLARNPENGYRIRTAGSYYHWDSDEVKRIIKAFPSNDPILPPLGKWIYFIVDTKEGILCFYHAQGSSLFVLAHETPSKWRDYSNNTSSFIFSSSELNRIAQIKSKAPFGDDVFPVIDSEGTLQSVLYIPYKN